jgi:hypothetical protein
VARLDEVETFLDSIEPRFQSIESAVHAGDGHFRIRKAQVEARDAFLDSRHPSLEVADVGNNAVELFVEPTQVNQNQVFRLSTHQMASSNLCAGRLIAIHA